MQTSREADSTLLIPFDVSAVDITEVGSLAAGTVHGYLMRTSSMYATQTLMKAHTDTITDVVVDHRRTQYMLSGSVDGRVQMHTNEFMTMSVDHGAPVRAVDFSTSAGTSYSAGDGRDQQHRAW
jgi:hypothetical protein